MNFSDLLSKIKAIDEGQLVNECGNIMAAPVSHDDGNVSISINMNGQGKDGVRDLMAVLRDIENGASDNADDILVGEPGDSHEEPVMGNIVDDMSAEMEEGGEFANASPNSSGQQTHGIEAVIPTGDDMHSKGGEAEKVNGGGNPMGVDESLVSRLSAMYNEIKESKKDKEPEGLYSKKRFETDSQRVARLAKEKRQAEKKEAEPTKEKVDESISQILVLNKMLNG